MNGGVYIVHDEALVEENGVLIVVAFPRGEADENVFAEADLALRGGGAVGDDIALLHALADLDDRALVEAGALVAARKLDELVVLALAAVVADGDAVRAHAGDDAVALCQDDNAGVDRAAVLDAGGNNGLLRCHQRNGLTLHVRAHQSTVRVVVFEERDHRGGDGDHHARGYVHEVDLFAVNVNDLVAVAAGHALVDKSSLLVKRLGRHGHDVLVFHVRRHVYDFLCDNAGLLVDAAVRRNEEAVLIHAGVGGQVVDKADVRTFGRFDRAEARVVAVVNVSHVEVGALAAQTAGAERGDTALMRKLGQRVCLIHELAQRA